MEDQGLEGPWAAITWSLRVDSFSAIQAHMLQCKDCSLVTRDSRKILCMNITHVMCQGSKSVVLKSQVVHEDCSGWWLFFRWFLIPRVRPAVKSQRSHLMGGGPFPYGEASGSSEGLLVSGIGLAEVEAQRCIM